ncbi:uncharacterized protein K452DRAFT_311334 [Aplosporella prunicola CBS 121167]|uniref:Aminotransferase class I/classII large domain-containing protein n=1 Tax=Aplosporella prunicola CBS 121167 TaxID=1176127 RepID=A0A6A6B645_9PEZI|nr:uncharacterized protein K452DRAFT_311334 [Aplosporella prunicola CBS 121167]KAF2138883.1 hypothetical protein K452DRAFT_311334 [Aplosporella prunicola CBS 121167]
MSSPKPAIDLLRGWPAASLLPRLRLRDAAVSALSDSAIWEPGLEYGPDEGYGPLRESIAEWLTEFYRPPRPVSIEEICITGGASQNLACILQVFTDPVKTRTIWAVEPTYHLAGRIFDDAGFHGRIRGVPEDEDGIDVAFLEAALVADEARAASDPVSESTVSVALPLSPSREKRQAPKQHQSIKPARPYRKLYTHVVYLVPSFSNPSGTTTSLARREGLLRLARRFDALVVCDDVYDFLHWPPAGVDSPLPYAHGAVLPRLVDLDDTLDGGLKDRFGNAVSNASFSKIVGPGVRVGWAAGTRDLVYGISQAGSTRSGGAPSQFTSTLVHELFKERYLQTHIETVLRPAYASRYCALVAAINEHLLPLGVTTAAATSENHAAAGGYFVWLQLPAGLSAAAVAKKALDEENLAVAEGGLFTVPEDDAAAGRLDKYVRLCFTWEDEGNIQEGVTRLARAVKKFL